jgi:hypothetical protein
LPAATFGLIEIFAVGVQLGVQDSGLLVKVIPEGNPETEKLTDEAFPEINEVCMYIYLVIVVVGLAVVIAAGLRLIEKLMFV